MEFNSVIGVAEVVSIIGGVWILATKIATLESTVKGLIPRLERLEHNTQTTPVDTPLCEPSGSS